MTDVEKSKKNGHDKSSSVSTNIIDSVDLTIEAYIGEATLTVKELNELDVESVVSLNVPLNQAVDLRLNGVPIAQGELVAVGDKFGVRIIEMAQ